MGGGPIAPEQPHPPHLLVVLPFPEPKQLLTALRKAHPKIQITYFDQRSWHQVPPRLYEVCTALCTAFALPANPRKDAPRLKWLHCFSAGTNWLTKHPIYTDTTYVAITSSSGVHGPQIAEWVFMTYMVHSHQYNTLYNLQKEHKWGGVDLSRVRDVAGQRIGVLGYGSIGRQVGRVARAMGMHLCAYTATPKDTPASRRDNGYITPDTGDLGGIYPHEWYSGTDKASLHRFLGAQLDWLVICVPLTPATRKLISSDEFEVLSRRKAFITNISRGPIVDTDALVTALENKQVRGAALDVVDPEPLPENHPLWDMPNVTVTPHISGQGSMYALRAFQILDINLLRRERGEKMINVVDRRRGY